MIFGSGLQTMSILGIQFGDGHAEYINGEGDYITTTMTEDEFASVVKNLPEPEYLMTCVGEGVKFVNRDETRIIRWGKISSYLFIACKRDDYIQMVFAMGRGVGRVRDVIVAKMTVNTFERFGETMIEHI